MSGFRPCPAYLSSLLGTGPEELRSRIIAGTQHNIQCCNISDISNYGRRVVSNKYLMYRWSKK